LNTTNTAEKYPRKTEAFGNAFAWLHSMVYAWVICIFLFTFAGRHITVNGTSMIPTLHDRDHLIISDFIYTPKHGDVVVVRKLTFNDEPIVKRIIAMEGQTVDIDFDTGTVYVDGVELDEPYINERMERTYTTIEFPLTVPESHIFVMGDNRNRSADSRDPRIGLIDEADILGKAYVIIWPIKNIRLL
jgi:signal peptidase I